ncbi:acetyl-CoA carboxylase biotin carboxylase subunit [Ferviditalea candida]|uniref:acetyl-CoA carboxylase biotin carboxylase subunit n=1 Tax=Ferviditalea candida TaxID=3108399 RepID=UPI00352D4459
MGPFKRVLIANRGEIALRIIRACRELGIETIQVYSEADSGSLPVQLADDRICIGGPKAADSYLNMRAIVSAALIKKADAVHPGYGFLAENARFAELCGQENVKFIGPSPEVIDLMGNKAAARKFASEAGVPVTPGSIDPVADLEEAVSVAEEIGFPVMLKASAGGGGRGMRVAYGMNELREAFARAKAEAKAAFSDDSLYIEKYLTGVRHIEVQILADAETVVHLGERDCTLQRRNQKLLEESPSPALSGRLREEITEAAVRLARHAGYQSAGTVEFIVDEATGRFHFIEMNTRIQVEHPVTEMITGIDLVKKQIEIAQGTPLGVSQEDIEFSGHAIECRINAEDAEKDFIPNPGEIQSYIPTGGPGIRMDSHIFAGYRVPPHYDSLLGKVIAWGTTREEAIARMKRALEDMTITGVATTVPFCKKLIEHPNFKAGRFNTRFVEDGLLHASLRE